MMNLGIVDRMKTCLSLHAVIILLSCETVDRIGKKLDVDYLVSDFFKDHFAVNTYMFGFGLGIHFYKIRIWKSEASVN